MAMGPGSEITPTIAAVFIPEKWIKRVQLATRKAQVLAATTDTQYEGEMSTGRIFHIAHALNLSVTAKSDNTVVVPDANTPTNQDVTISRYVYSSFNVQSVTQVQDGLGYMETMSGQIGYALNGDVEDQLTDLPASLTSNTAVGAYGAELSMDDWETIVQTLDAGLAPRGRDRFSWISSKGESAWRKLGTPISRDFTAANQNALDDATISRFLGMTLVVSQYLNTSGGGTQSVAFHRQQFILVRQVRPKVEKQRILGDLADLVVGWELYTTAERQIVAEAAGAESLTDKFGVLVKTV